MKCFHVCEHSKDFRYFYDYAESAVVKNQGPIQGRGRPEGSKAPLILDQMCARFSFGLPI